jgi:hypothetical protein
MIDEEGDGGEEQLQMQQQLELQHMKVTQLKDICRELGLKVGGKKQILIQRIIQAQVSPDESSGSAASFSEQLRKKESD